MKKIITLMVLVLCSVLPSFTQNRILYIKVLPETQSEISSLERKSPLKDRFIVVAEPTIANKVKQWQKTGFDREEFWDVFSSLLDKPESIGATFSKVADMLIKHTNHISNTKVGKLAIAMFLWKLAGPSIIVAILKIILLVWMVWFGIWWWRKNHVKHNLPIRTSNVKQFQLFPLRWRYDVIEKHILDPKKDHDDTESYQWSVGLQLGFFVIMFLIILIA